MSRLLRLVERFGSRPTHSQSLSCGLIAEAEQSAPVAEASRFAPEFNQYRGTPIIHLSLWRTPLAVVRFIVAVIVDSIQRMAFGHFAHIAKEAVKSLPVLANLNASAAVVFIAGVFWIVAPLHHMKPAAVCSDARITASAKTLRDERPSQTSTGLTATEVNLWQGLVREAATNTAKLVLLDTIMTGAIVPSPPSSESKVIELLADRGDLVDLVAHRSHLHANGVAASVDPCTVDRGVAVIIQQNRLKDA